MADQRITDIPTALLVPALNDLLEIAEVSDTTDDPSGSSRKIEAGRLLAHLFARPAQGRLTLESGNPISTTDQTAKTSVFCTPYGGNLIALYDGTGWKLYVFTERTLALGTLTSGKQYDIFLFDNAGTLTLELSAAWTNDTTRADALTTQDGITVKSGALTRRWLGTIRTASTTTTEDSKLNRFVWNAYNQVERDLDTTEITDSHTYNVATVREWHGGTSSTRLSFIVGSLGTGSPVVTAELYVQQNVGIGFTGVNLDNPATGNVQLGIPSAAGTTGQRNSATVPFGLTAIGFHQLIVIEYGNASTVPSFGVYHLQATVRC